MELSILELILCIFFTALAVTVLFRKLRLSIILGYLVVGALVGPHALGLAHNSQFAKDLAEFGIVFLMFTVGLEFSLPKLFALRKSVFVIGSLQVFLTTSITAFVGFLLGMTKLSAVAVGSVVAMSSTAIVIKQLNDQSELLSRHGLNAVGILLFQDLAVIPIIILIAGLAQGTQKSLSLILAGALIKGLIAIFLIFLIGRWLLRPLFHSISKTRAIELFTLTVLLVTLFCAWLTNLFGLSYALGAFLAGLMLAETEFRHQIEVEIRPFRDILLALFFITIGMLADISTWYKTSLWIGLLVFALVIGKMALISCISYFAKIELPVALRTGIVLAQGGEFSFAILTLALSNGILPGDYGQVVLAALLISIALAPILIRFNKEITTFLIPRPTKISNINAQRKIIHQTKSLKQHAIICGYGRVGQHIARLLDKVKFPYISLDLDAELVKSASLAGEHVIYGDPVHPGILKAAGIDHAKILVISFSDLNASIKILSMVRQTHPNLPILIRCRDEFELKQLKTFGAKNIIAELFEASLTLSHQLLNLIEIPQSKIAELIQDIRHKDYDLLQKVFSGSQRERSHAGVAPEELKPFFIPDGAFAINKNLKELRLKKFGVEIFAIRRGESKVLKPRTNVKIQPEDILILYGSSDNLEVAENILINGN